jgi:para-aminobenzoate synthetase component 2
MAPHVLVIDNYDSFTYNLVQYLRTLGAECEVVLNDQHTVEELLAKKPDGILLSPGPGTPDDAGVTLETITRAGGKIPIFGVCLGHQSIGQAHGATVVRAERLMHGKTSPILHEGKGVFAGLPEPFLATRYHSLVIKPSTMPDCLEVTARTAEGEIMGVRHTSLPIEGVQFHPESILTESGLLMMQNWLDTVARSHANPS